MATKKTTVAKLIEILKKFDQEAIVCRTEWGTAKMTHYSIDTINEIKKAKYINGGGDYEKGKIISIH